MEYETEDTYLASVCFRKSGTVHFDEKGLWKQYLGGLNTVEEVEGILKTLFLRLSVRKRMLMADTYCVGVGAIWPIWNRIRTLDHEVELF